MIPDLDRLQQELADAGIAVAALGEDANGVHTYDAEGQRAELPPEAAAVIAAHVPETHPDLIAQADEAFYAAMSAATTVAQIKAATLAWMASRPGIAVPTPANG